MKRYDPTCSTAIVPNKMGTLVTFDDVILLVEEINKFIPYIGKKVAKCAKYKRGKVRTKNGNVKPFKSGLFTNTVKGISIHPFLGFPVFTFEEDDSYVACKLCMIIEDSEKFKGTDYLEEKYGHNWEKIVFGGKRKRYQVLENGEPAVLEGSPVWNNCVFDSFEEAKVYICMWAFPVDRETAQGMTKNMNIELNDPLNCALTEEPVMMEIREID